MLRFVRWMLLALLVGVPALSARADKADPPRHVQDDAGFFNAKAKEEANATIAKIKRTHGKDLLVETVENVKRPAGVDPKDKDAFFTRWAIDRFKNQHIDGIYVVIVTQQHVVRVVTGDVTRDLGYFTTQNRDQLRDLVVAKLKAKDADGALLQAVHFVEETLAKNHAPTTAPKATSPKAAAPPAGKADGAEMPPWVGFVCIGLVVLVVLWLVVGMMRSLSGGGAGAPGMAGGGGGGFFSSLLGGLFGAAAGMWVYNTFFGGHHGPTYPGGDSSQGGTWSNEGPTDVGGGASASGGDYGSDTSGGDVSGGDWGGGGDAGGGDW